MKKIPLSISPEEFLHLYQTLHIDELAKVTGIKRSTLGNKRRELGIPGKKKWELNETAYKVEHLEGRLKSLLIGSMLGDGNLARSSEHSTRYNEKHGKKQKEYLKWKCGIWGENWIPRGTTEGREIHEYINGDTERPNFHIRTIAHPLLNDWYDMFYTGEKGTLQNKKTKELLDPAIIDHVDEFALAIWYLDDGHAGQFPSIAFGMKQEQSKRIVREIFQKFGLNPKWVPAKTKEGKEKTNGIFRIGFKDFSEDADRFYDLISPHVPECMKFKLDWLNRVGRNSVVKKILKTNEEWIRTQCSLGVGIRTQAKRLKVSYQALDNFLKENNISHPRRPGFHGHLDNIIDDYDNEDILSQEVVIFKKSNLNLDIQKIYQTLRNEGFPEDKINKEAKDLESLKKDFLSLRNKGYSLEENFIKPASYFGLSPLSPYFPHRYNARWRGGKTAREAWFDEAILKRAIKSQLEYGENVDAKSVLRKLQSFVHTPTIFRPCFMKFMAENYSRPNDWIWDPCMGYGGRLMGTLVANRRYVGTEIQKETFVGNQELYEDLQKIIPNLENRAVLIHGKAQDFTFSEKVSLVFTSPPYFNTEQYGSEKMRISYDQWVESFLRSVIRKSFLSLKDDGIFSMNVAKVKDGSKGYDIPSSVLEVAEQEGFIFEDEIKMPISGLNEKDHEPILIFKK